MPRTYSKRNNHRNDITARVPVASNLSPNAPEFIPISKYYFYTIILKQIYLTVSLKKCLINLVHKDIYFHDFFSRKHYFYALTLLFFST